MRIGSLFSGIGGLDIAVHSGLKNHSETIWFCENDASCTRVLNKRFPNTPVLGDIKTVDWGSVKQPDIVTAGYPCTPFSVAGKRLGLEDENYLWPEVVRCLEQLETYPKYVFCENVAAHLEEGFFETLRDLARLGYDAVWGIVKARDAGAVHRRRRLFALAYRNDGSALPDTDPPRLEKPFKRHDKTVFARIHSEAKQYSLTMRQAEALKGWVEISGNPMPLLSVEKDLVNADFMEWMMGFEAGWVTGILGRRPAIEALGNSVCPQQGHLAFVSLIELAKQKS